MPNRDLAGECWMMRRQSKMMMHDEDGGDGDGDGVMRC